MRNNPIYTTALAGVSSFAPSLYTFICIYARNPFNLDFVLLNHSIKGILTFIIFILLSLSLQTALSPCNWSKTAYNCPLITTCKSASKLSAILVLFYLDVIAADDDTAALGGILLNLSCLL